MISVAPKDVKGTTIALDLLPRHGVSWQCRTSWSQYVSSLWDLPKELSTSAKTDARDKDVRFFARCTMLIVCPSLKTSCLLLHPQDGIRPPRPAAAFCAKVYLHHADGWELGVCCPLHLRPACEAYVATSRQDPRVIDPGPESKANMPGCCTNTHLALTTKEMLAAVGGVGFCAFMIFSHNLATCFEAKGTWSKWCTQLYDQVYRLVFLV